MNINTKQYIEKYIKIRDKAGKIIDLKINQGQQKLYDAIKKQHDEKKPIRIIVLKARQIGFSTLTEGIIFKNTATKFNVNAGIITHKEEATTNLFNMSKRMYDNLPDNMKPSLKRSNAKELIFDNDEGTGLKSKIKCMTAGSSGVGRSDTFNYLHISELAFWGNNAKETTVGLFQAVPNLPNTMIVIESTANGFEYFKELWDMAVNGENDFIPVFVGWNELDDYRVPYNGFELTDYERELQRIYNLSLEQLAWRRWCIKNNCGGDVEQFKQEYPINPQEAFISSGTCIFDKEIVINRIQELPKPLKIGYFEYKYDDTKPGNKKISDIRWVNDKNGYIEIYETPNIYQYCIGGDTAGEGSDWFTGHVLNAKTGKQVARLRHQMDEDLYVRQMYCLGYHYKHQNTKTGIITPALMCIESNFSSYPNKELVRLGYPNLFVREKEDRFSGVMDKSYGFRTTSVTRPVIIAELVKIVRESVELINDKLTLEEMLTFVRNEKGRPEAQQGAHDDLVMGLAIAYYSRNQVVFDVEPVTINQVFNFDSEQPEEYDYGEEIVVI